MKVYPVKRTTKDIHKTNASGKFPEIGIHAFDSTNNKKNLESTGNTLGNY